MYTTTWATSEREHDVVVDRDVMIEMSDGVRLNGDVYRPAAEGRYPVILGISPYNKHLQSAPMMPIGFTPQRGFMETGDPNFFVRRGYVHAVVNVRGSGWSEGFYQFNNRRELEDAGEVVEWLAKQPWSDGNVGMFGVSMFAKIAKGLSALDIAPSLKAIFAPWSANEWYRSVWYHGGILNARFLSHWRFSPHRLRYRSLVREAVGDEAYQAKLDAARQDDELMAHDALREALLNPAPDANALLVDLLLNPLDGPFWQERNIDGEPGVVPAWLGADWGNYGCHLPTIFEAWEAYRGPKKLMIGPPVYLDRPLYQLQGEAVRWFDHWLRGVDTGVMDDPDIRCFMPGTGQWRELSAWPPPEARWTPFNLHEKGTLSEREWWPNEGVDNIDESPYEHGEVVYRTPAMVEETEILGPPVLNLFVSCTGPEALLFATLLKVDADGNETELTRGWLRASQRRLHEESTRWAPVQAHTEREPLEPGRVYELRFPIVATACVLRPGERLALRIKGFDDEPSMSGLDGMARMHLALPRPVRITIHHDEDHPSRLELPITRGNLLGTFFSGGVSEFTTQARSST
jgi:predicted acyl esterase